MEVKGLVKKVFQGKTLGFDEARSVFDAVFEGELSSEEVAAFLVALALRGETPEEVAAAIDVADAKKIRVEHQVKDVVDTCGTGGDGRGTFNVSTASALVLASIGVAVAKHGNRAVTGKVGSADIVGHIGIAIAETPDEAAKMLKEHGFAFLFAPRFHPAFAKVAPVRRALGVPTIFNLLGPQVNPCDPVAQLVGVYSYRKAKVVAEALYLLGRRNRVIVTSEDGLDEVSSAAPTKVLEVRDQGVKEWIFYPQKLLGNTFEVPVVSTKEEAFEVFDGAISGRNERAAKVVALNAAFAMYALGLCDVDEGYRRALEAIGSGSVEEYVGRIKGVLSS